MSSGFITESEVEAQKKLRQEEWAKVRKPEDPEEAPELPLADNRSLYDRLQEQKMRKQEEFEEAHKLKNLVKGLDDDEADFLEYVDKTKMDLERQKILEEKKELNEFRSKIAELREQELNKHIKQELGLVKNEKKKTYDDELPSIGTRKTTQSKLLAGIVKRKTPTSINEATTSTPKKQKMDDDVTAEANNSSEQSKVGASTSVISATRVLPGLASYSDSSNSEDDNSSDSERGDSVPRDLCGRQLVQVEEEESSEGKKKKS